MKIFKCENIFEKYFSRLPWKFYSGEELNVNAYQCGAIAAAFRSAFGLDEEIGMIVDPFVTTPLAQADKFFRITENKKARLCFFNPGSRPGGIIGFFQLFENEDSEDLFGEKTKFSKERIWFLIESVEDAAKVCGYFGRVAE